ncbi:T9SS type A sorting domain-containing protein [Pontibacter ruber]|uniref:T9SS type A sorting domain-containing protein n=1 Tax=Pontibacter ruber TaxID=1343895 RepID=A0ABW5CU70_9BACT|nr:T9SS type A sorting domain-containing protein [Pontibacter ruber]
MKIRYLLLSLALLLLIPLAGKATHISGGYFSYTVDPQNPLKYKFTFTLFDNDQSPADDPQIQVSMGDMNKVVAPRIRIIPYYNNTELSVYEWEYTYQQPGDYLVYWNGIFRNGGMVNVAGPSDFLSQFIHTRVQARLVSRNNHSVRTLVPAPFEAFLGEPFKINMLAYDADGDELYYQLVPSQYLDKNGIPRDLPGYRIPAGMSINQAGELKWENPAIKGPYAISVKITEYRNQVPIGYTIVDINLSVLERGQPRGDWSNTNTVHPRVSLVNQNRLTFDSNGFVRAKADQPLKLEFYVEKAPNSTNSALSARQFSDIDTLDLAAPTMAVRDSANGLAVTVRLNPTPDIKPSYLYTIGLRGATRISNYIRYDYGWDFVSFYYGELQLPTAAADEIPKNKRVVYPNPVRQEFTVEATGPSTLLLYSAEGRLVHRFHLTAGKNELTKPAALAPGLYTYRIMRQGNLSQAGKVLLQ